MFLAGLAKRMIKMKPQIWLLPMLGRADLTGRLKPLIRKLEMNDGIPRKTKLKWLIEDCKWALIKFKRNLRLFK